MSPKDYSTDEHRHRFAAWAATRAAQTARVRGTSADALVPILDNSYLREFVRERSQDSISVVAFNEFHETWVQQIQEWSLSIDERSTLSFGVAAKVVAVYIKAMVVVGPDGNYPLAQVAHPPIDEILLKKLAEEKGASESFSSFRSTHSNLREHLKMIAWTKLGRDEYYELSEFLRSFNSRDAPQRPFWEIERYWTAQK